MPSKAATRSIPPARSRGPAIRLSGAVGVIAGILLACSATDARAAKAACTDANLLQGKAPAGTNGISGTAALVTDGVVSPEGTLWNSQPVLLLGNENATLTYDLGQETELTAFFVQADANDTYEVAVSTDDSPNSYKVVTQFPNVVSQGHGLRLRAAKDLPPVKARFVRIGKPHGDGRFSISEFGAFCKAPSPFPPSMQLAKVDQPPAPAPAAAPADAPQPGAAAPTTETGGSNLRTLLLVVAGVVILLIGRKLFGKGGDDAPSGETADAETPSAEGAQGSGAAEAAEGAPGEAVAAAEGGAADDKKSNPPKTE